MTDDNDLDIKTNPTKLGKTFNLKYFTNGFKIHKAFGYPVLLHSISAYAVQGKRMVWSKTPNKRTGLYTTRNPYTSNGFFITANAMYYFGDVDNGGVAFNGGFNKENLSYGGSLIIGYIMPMPHHFDGVYFRKPYLYTDRFTQCHINPP